VFQPVSAAQMQRAQILTGLGMAAFLAAGFIPGLRPYAAKIRAAVLAIFLLGCAVLIVDAVW
jgi:hypothetical protein